MLEYREDPIHQIVEITIDGFINVSNFSDVIQALEVRMNEWGKVKLIKIVKDFDGFDPLILVDNMKFAYKHLRDFSQIAVVTDKKWAPALTKLIQPLYPCPLKVFDEDDLDEARKWIQQE